MKKFVHINIINEVKRPCFEGALLFALFFLNIAFEKSEDLEKSLFSVSCALPTLRVGRSATSLTVH